MILTKLTLHNFGIYAGRHEINLEPKENKPIILFGALNGSGKTTLLEGIQFALFGKFAAVDIDEITTYLTTENDYYLLTEDEKLLII